MPHTTPHLSTKMTKVYSVEEEMTKFGFTKQDIAKVKAGEVVKPSIALQHKVVWTDSTRDMKCIFNRTFYVSQGHNSVQQGGVVLPTGDGKMLMIFSSRTSTDAVSGFGGAAKRSMGSRIMGGKIAENMAAIRDSLKNKQV